MNQNKPKQDKEYTPLRERVERWKKALKVRTLGSEWDWRRARIREILLEIKSGLYK